VGRRRLFEDVLETDRELGVTVRSVLMWYRTGCSSRSSVQGISSINAGLFEHLSICSSVQQHCFAYTVVISLSCRLLDGCLFVSFILPQLIHYLCSV